MKLPYPRRRDVGAILLFIAAMGILTVFSIIFSHLTVKRAPGFGPDWECANLGEGEPVCFQKRATPNQIRTRDHWTLGLRQDDP
jgi:hypothetical protein